jgi:apolipoprotein N-acyltransferase
MKLVPFGERVPFVDQLPFLGNLIKWGVGLSGWNVGQDTSLFKIALSDGINKTDLIKIDGLVCYESIYPILVSRFVSKGADFIAVVTNDSWYGKLSGPYQHKEFAALRAVENRKSVIRAANGGVSCLINPLGVIEAETEMFTKTFLVVDVPIQTDETFFSNNPLIIPLISSAVSLWILGLFVLKKIKHKFKL